MRRVKNIQERVMPLINNENHHVGVDEEIGWKNKMEQKVARLETEGVTSTESAVIPVPSGVSVVPSKRATAFKI